MNIKGAIFDADGTLFDSMFIWDTIGADYLISRGIQPKENLNETFKSMSLLQAAKYYQSEYGLTDSVERIMNGVNSMIAQLYADVIELKSGVKEMLERFRQMDVKMCIVTATDRDLVEAALKRNGISGYFSDIFTCSETGYGKDNPMIYIKALEFLGTNKAETIVFEDALYAIKTARMAGFHVIAVYDLSAEAQRTEIQNLADEYIDSFTDWNRKL